MSKKLKIVELGDKMLRMKTKRVFIKEIKTKKFQNFCDDLILACKNSNGVGIASPQVGILKKVFVVWSRSNKRYLSGRNFSSKKYLSGKNIPKIDPLVVINPKIISTSKKILKAYEGCLSIPGIRGIVPRHESVDVEFINIEGEKVKTKFQKFPARIFQHEFDHLNGIVFLDRVDSRSLITEKEYKKILKNKGY